MTTVIRGIMPKDVMLIKNLPGINNATGKIFWNDFVDKYKNDPRLDVYDVYFLDELVRYYSKPKNWGQNWTKARAYSYFSKGPRKLTKYRIDKIYGHLIGTGYMTQTLYIPHKIDENIELNPEVAKIDTKYHAVFYWLYEINFQPEIKEDNTVAVEEKIKVEEENMLISNDNMVAVMEESFNTEVDNTEENITDSEDQEETIDDAYILEQYKAGVFENVMRTNIDIDSKDTIKKYIVNEVEKFDSLESVPNDNLYTLCWNTIVKSIAYNEKAFINLCNTDVGKKMATINKRAIERSFLEYSMYCISTSKITDIRNNAANSAYYRKKLLIHSTLIIHNYIKLGFLENKKLPDYKELIGLYKVLNDNPTLIYTLKYNKNSYQELHDLFISNQARFNMLS